MVACKSQRSCDFDICLQLAVCNCDGQQLLQQRIRSRILCSVMTASDIMKRCTSNNICNLDDLRAAAPNHSETALLGISPREIQQLICTESEFQSTVEFQLRKMQDAKYNIRLLREAAEAISKIADTVQDLQSVTVTELIDCGVPLVVRAWLCQQHLVQGSGQKEQAYSSLQEHTAIQEHTFDPTYASMETAVLEVKTKISDWCEHQLLSSLPENMKSGHKQSIEYGCYSQHGIYVADRIPVTQDEHFAANNALRDQGFILINTESVALEVADSPDFKAKVKGSFSSTVCMEESTARECLEFQEEVLTGEDTDSDEEAEKFSDSSKVQGQESRSTAHKKRVEQEKKSRSAKSGRAAANPKKAVPNITAILFCVHAFLASVNFDTIFQAFKQDKGGDLTEDGGDGKRLQAKMRQLPDVKKKQGETDDSFQRRFAGREFLFQFMIKVFTLLSNWLPKEFAFDRFWNDMYAGIVKTLGHACGQHLHADKEPDRHGLGAAALVNLSIWSYWITSLIRSAKNVEALLQYYRQAYDLFATAYIANSPEIAARALSEGQLKEVLSRPWQCHLDLHVRNHPGSFHSMKLAEIELVPFMMKVFSLNHVHGGGPYPGRVPRRLRDYSPAIRKRKPSAAKRRWRYRYGKAHFRSGSECHQFPLSHQINV